MSECAFCPKQADSREHVWSAWIGELFKSSGYNFRRITMPTGDLAKWRRPTLDEKTRVVCEKCNNGWMSDIEGRSQAAFSGMIRDGTKISLLPRGTALLAAFAFKCAVIADHASPHGGPFFTRFARRQFRESLQIPSGVRMWAAAFHDPIGHRGIFNSYYTTPRGDTFNDLEFYVFTFLAGHLALQVHATRWTKLRKCGTPFPIVEPETYWDTRAATEFWPSDGFPVSWPPSLNLSGNMLQQFIHRWTGSVRIQI